VDTSSQVELLLSGVACPSTSQCTAIDTHGREVTFDPTSSGTPTVTTVDAGQPLHGVACPSSNQCTVVDQSGGQVTFDPPSPGTPTRMTLEQGEYLNDVACPTTSRCIAIDYDAKLTFDPTSPGTPTRTTIGSGALGEFLNAIACPVASQCTAVTGSGSALHKRIVVLGSATVTVAAGHHATIKISLMAGAGACSSNTTS